MKIYLPPLRIVSKHKVGETWKDMLRAATMETEVNKLQADGKPYYSLKSEGNEILITFNKLAKGITDKYRYILSQGDTAPDETETSLDLLTFNWVKHPLLTTHFAEKFTKEYVLTSWKDNFTLRTDTEHGEALRIPQVGALYAIQAHWTVSHENAIVVLPTGTGKTDAMIACTVIAKATTTLVVVPTDALRDQLANKYITLGVLPQYKIMSQDCESPIVGFLRHRLNSITEVDTFFDEANVIIATMSVISGCIPEVQRRIAEKTSHLFIDEAHHTPAETWRTFKKLFTKNKVVQFTATPFRNDGQRLDGKIVYNFPLKRAQELEYFKPIHFLPIHEYEYKLADQLIAEAAVKQLKEDLAAGYDHILMVRVNLIARGEEIWPLYSVYEEFHPVIVHSQIKPGSRLKSLIQDVINKRHRIIICVDMLGEGFDLPELKIAAFHDTKKSLTITLQLAGRFTRVKKNLGPATFIANIADPSVHEDLEDLYYRDSDWNLLLPDLSYKMSLEQEDFRAFLEGFKGFPDKFPVQSIKHPLSTIIYQAPSEEWKPLLFKEGIKGIDNFDHIYPDYNKEQNIFILILGKRAPVDWARVQDFESINWHLIVCYFDKATRLLYLHASNTNSYFNPLVQAICEGAQLLKGEMIFRCFANMNRIRLHNVGVREPMGRAINFIMRVGSDIKTALKDTEIKKAIKSNVFGVGFENGSRITIGCSHHGRIWSMRTNNILTWTKWCQKVAVKVTDPTIDPDLVLKGTLIPKEIGSIPDIKAFEIEWPDKIFRESIGNFYLTYSNEEYPIWNCDIQLKTQSTGEINFEVQLPSGNHMFTLKVYVENQVKKCTISSSSDLYIKEGNQKTLLAAFLEMYPPLIYFIDGSFLEGNFYTEIHHVIPAFPVDHFQLYDWEGVDIRKESQTYEKHSNTIQYYLIQKLIESGQYHIIMDDDDKGEIGDIVAFKIFEEQRILSIDVYHCKYSSKDTPGMRLDDFYEVCGQAQRSIKWMENIEEIFLHLGRRSSERLRRVNVTRFEVGDENSLDLLKRRAKKDLKVKMNIFIVQPGLAFSDYNENSEISRLLAVVQTYLKETWNAELQVLASE